MSNQPPLHYKQLLSRVQSLVKSAKSGTGDSAPEVKDPTNTGTVTVPEHPGEAISNKQLPGGANGASLPATSTDVPANEIKHQGTLEGGAPSTVDGVAQDNAVTTPTAKLASQVTATAARLSSLLKKEATGTKAASEPVKGLNPTVVVQPGESFTKSAEDAASKPKADQVRGTADPTEHGEVKPSKKNGPEDLPKGGTTNDASPAEKAASDFDLDTASLVKLARTMLATERGFRYATEIIKEAKGADFARQLIADATRAQDNFAKAAAAQAEGEAAAEALLANTTPADRELMGKIANVVGAVMQEVDARADLTAEQKFQFKSAAAQGAMDAASMADTGSVPGGQGEQPSLEDIIAVIQQLVQSGQLPLEVAQQLVAEISGGAGAEGGAPAGGPPAGAPPEAAGSPGGDPAGAAPPAAAPDTPEPKAEKAAADKVATYFGAAVANPSAEAKAAVDFFNATA